MRQIELYYRIRRKGKEKIKEYGDSETGGKGDRRTWIQRQIRSKKKKQGHQEHNSKKMWKQRTLENIILKMFEPGKKKTKKLGDKKTVRK